MNKLLSWWARAQGKGHGGNESTHTLTLFRNSFLPLKQGQPAQELEQALNPAWGELLVVTTQPSQVCSGLNFPM